MSLFEQPAMACHDPMTFPCRLSAGDPSLSNPKPIGRQLVLAQQLQIPLQEAGLEKMIDDHPASVLFFWASL